MRRISFWFLSTVSAVVLLFGYDASRTHPTTSAAPSFTTGTTGTTGATSTTSGTTTSGASATPRASPSSGSSTSSADGSKTAPATTTVTGAVVNTVWGPVQVQLRVSGGAIAKIGILQYPNGNGRDVEIANYALPVLIQETMKAQSASVDMVSGATYTSTGYIQSLQSALDRANL